MTDNKPHVKLVGENGNAFSIIAAVRKALRDAGQEEDAKAFVKEAMSGDYDNVLRSAMKYCEVE